ncbi:MAG TPA: carboxypeptidase-like regulatory domain-containing protein [Candidatus Polarisedimenticolaceae bacterium]|nr:carboxypeptidase-like regulatory domain-containing protein [Candidatus Polarisedimenticolaceae bacterium]
MMALRALRSLLSVLLVLAVVSSSMAAPLAPAQLRGRVLDADGRTPRTGVTVVLVDESGQARYRSEPSTARGVFRIHGADAGTYRLLAETTEGAFLAPQAVDLAAGDTRALSLSLTPGQPEPEPPAPEPTPEPPAPSEPTTPPPAEPTTPPPATPAPVTPVETGPQWRKWVIVGGIGVAALLVINEMTDEDEASPF